MIQSLTNETREQSGTNNSEASPHNGIIGKCGVTFDHHTAPQWYPDTLSHTSTSPRQKTLLMVVRDCEKQRWYLSRWKIKIFLHRKSNLRSHTFRCGITQTLIASAFLFEAQKASVVIVPHTFFSTDHHTDWQVSLPFSKRSSPSWK